MSIPPLVKAFYERIWEGGDRAAIPAGCKAGAARGQPAAVGRWARARG
jgi:hypothetical protein